MLSQSLITANYSALSTGHTKKTVSQPVSSENNSQIQVFSPFRQTERMMNSKSTLLKLYVQITKIMTRKNPFLIDFILTR